MSTCFMELFALFTWQWFYFKELESFMGQGELCCLFAYILRRGSPKQPGARWGLSSSLASLSQFKCVAVRSSVRSQFPNLFCCSLVLPFLASSAVDMKDSSSLFFLMVVEDLSWSFEMPAVFWPLG